MTSEKSVIQAAGKVFLTGGTGYIGRHLVAELLRRDVGIYALTRQVSSRKYIEKCTAVLGDALNRNTYQEKLKTVDTFVHLVGVSHPGPLKAGQFRAIDLKSVQEAVAAAVAEKVGHFVYISVAHPAPVMKAYWQVRQECETTIRESGLNATVVRPWYVLGPGHRWPYLLLPVYRLFERIPATAETCTRLGLVSLEEMVAALASAVTTPARGFKVIDVPLIRQIAASEIATK